MTFECFNCSISFSQSESLAKNTSLEQSKTYCSKECETKDSEALEEAIKEEQLRIAEQNKDSDKLREEITKTIGQFKLKVENT